MNYIIHIFFIYCMLQWYAWSAKNEPGRADEANDCNIFDTKNGKTSIFPWLINRFFLDLWNLISNTANPLFPTYLIIQHFHLYNMLSSWMLKSMWKRFFGLYLIYAWFDKLDSMNPTKFDSSYVTVALFLVSISINSICFDFTMKSTNNHKRQWRPTK